ncbi:MAG: trypsin-like peptidase domain-containing protein [Oscillospiraceae bacterium]|nr:trypsin-like peptidase domain-containing protein [Oscillospiraceae bacterium]
MLKNMKTLTRSAISAIVICILAMLSTLILAPKAGFDNFTLSGEYSSRQFYDVDDSQWFARYVEDAYNYGLFHGKSENFFDHSGSLTMGETITLAARLSKIYHDGNVDFIESSPFYAVYADYALSRGIIDRNTDYYYDAPATRAEFALLVYRALPTEAFPPINDIADYGICDVAPDDSDYGGAVYALYRAGILSGSDGYGTFAPNSGITRAQACAIAVRIADPVMRDKLSLPSRMPAEVIFKRSMDAVFMLETFDSDGDPIRTGTGFFVSASGLAVTNLHVLESAASATVTLFDGKVYPVSGINDISDEDDLALFSIDADLDGFPYLTLFDSDLVEAGNTVYALGNPQNLINTITDGIISNTSRDVDGSIFIQFTAPISFGSGGSPVLNTLGQVVGVASISFTDGQNVNFAVPVNYVKELHPGELVALDALLVDQV